MSRTSSRQANLQARQAMPFNAAQHMVSPAVTALKSSRSDIVRSLIDCITAP